MNVRFHYRLSGLGWAQCRLAIEQSSVRLSASYVSDALASLLAAACQILNGAPESSASFDEEPGEFRWRFRRIDDYCISVAIVEFHELWSHKPDSEGKLILEAVCPMGVFASAIYIGCKEVLSQYGRDGYKQRWHCHDFPESDFSALGRLLRNKHSR